MLRSRAVLVRRVVERQAPPAGDLWHDFARSASQMVEGFQPEISEGRVDVSLHPGSFGPGDRGAPWFPCLPLDIGRGLASRRRRVHL
jgi:hypothetical protein